MNVKGWAIDKATRAAIKAIKNYESDFGTRPKEGGQAEGRQIGYRPLVAYYLQSFLAKQETKELPELLRMANVARKKHEQAVLEKKNLYPHRSSMKESDWKKRISEEKAKGLRGYLDRL